MLSHKEFMKLVEDGETLTVEFKGEEKGPISDNEIVETVVCMANTEGGYIFLGVEDDKRITGAKPRSGSQLDITGLSGMILNMTRPNHQVNIQIMPHKDVNVVIIHVPPSIRAIGTSAGLFKKRVIGSDGKPACLPYFPHEHISDLSKVRELDYSAALIEDLDETSLENLEVERLFAIIREYPKSDKNLLDISKLDALKALGILREYNDHLCPTIAGLLLLGKKEILNNRIPTHELAFQLFEGTDVTINEFLKDPLLRSLDKIWNYFSANNKVRSTQSGLFRVDIPDYDETAFRESLNNAVLHRDYTQLGTVHVQWNEYRIQISNPGGFVRGVSIHNILSVSPTPRNPLLADIFKRIGLVERSGRGVDLIFSGQLNYGRELPSYSQSTNEKIVINIPNGPPNTGFMKLLGDHEEQYHKPFDFEHLYILDCTRRRGKLSLSNIAVYLQRSENEISVFSSYLVENEYLSIKTEIDDIYYSLSGSVKAKLMPPKKLSKKEVEDKVINFLKINKRVTRKEVIELCGITGNQAYKILKRLNSSGKIIQKGKLKSAWYELAKE